MLVGLALIAMGAGAGLVSSAVQETGARLIAPNAPVNAGAADPRDITAHNSPSIARSPLREGTLAVANRIDTPRFSCALHLSSDAGFTWQQVAIPFPEGEEAPPRCFAPDVAFGADGTLHVAFVTLAGPGNVPHGAWHTSARPGSDVLSAPTKAGGPLTFQVRLAADTSRPGRLYLSWLQASNTATLAFPEAGNPIVLARSDDGGLTWTSPLRVSPPARARVVAPSVVAGPRDDVYLSYLDLGGDVLDYHGAHGAKGGPPFPGPWELVLARSQDGGQRWVDTVVAPRLTPTERIIVFFPPSPSLAVDPRGERMYIAFHDGSGGDADVLVWASANGGKTFGEPRRVNDNRLGDGTAQYLPRLAVAPNGRVDVVYYDRRADKENVRNEVSLQWSEDGGQSFSPRLRMSDRAFDSRIGLGSERGLPDLGSRLGVVSSRRRAVAAWADTRAGTEASNKQDLVRAVVAFTHGSRLWTWLRYLGVGVAATGGVVLALAVVSRRRRGTARSP